MPEIQKARKEKQPAGPSKYTLRQPPYNLLPEIHRHTIYPLPPHNMPHHPPPTTQHPPPSKPSPTPSPPAPQSSLRRPPSPAGAETQDYASRDAGTRLRPTEKLGAPSHPRRSSSQRPETRGEAGGKHGRQAPRRRRGAVGREEEQTPQGRRVAAGQQTVQAPEEVGSRTGRPMSGAEQQESGAKAGVGAGAGTGRCCCCCAAGRTGT